MTLTKLAAGVYRLDIAGRIVWIKRQAGYGLSRMPGGPKRRVRRKEIDWVVYGRGWYDDEFGWTFYDRITDGDTLRGAIDEVKHVLARATEVS